MDFVYHGNELNRCLSNGNGSLSSLEEGKAIVLDDYKTNLKKLAKASGKRLLTVNDCINDSIANAEESFGLGMQNMRNLTWGQMVYISPMEVQSLYQAGIPKRIEDNKGRGCLTTGIEVINRKLSDDDNRRIADNLENKGFIKVVSDGMMSSLCYGGNLLFPIFHKDNRTTYDKPLGTLIKLGVVGKDCVDYFVNLDRWNVFVIPPVNPTQKDFENPDYFTIPFLNSRLKSSRCSRMVACPQLGYWGTIINLGWGISDFTHYLQSYLDYEMCVQALNGMVKNMSIVYRKIPFEHIMASDGLNAVRKSIEELKEALDSQTASDKLNHIVNFDTIGDLGCINRDFKEMENIITLKRQDLCAKAGTYEPLIFTIKKGSFSSGDDTQGTLTKQYESNEMFYNNMAMQMKSMAMLMTIDALGTSNRVMSVLQYSSMNFVRPIAVSALEKAQIGKIISEGVLNYGSMNIPVNYGIDLMDEYVDNKEMVSKELREKLTKIENEKESLALEKQKAEIEAIKAQAKASAISSSESDGDDYKEERKAENLHRKNKNAQRDMTVNKSGKSVEARRANGGREN